MLRPPQQQTNLPPQTAQSSENQYPYFFFTQVNRRVNPYLMKDNELYDSLNWWTERTIGAKKVRPGYTLFLNRADNNPVKGLFFVKFANGNLRLARISGGNIWIADPNSSVGWGGTPKYTTANSLVWPDYTVMAGKAHIVSQVSPTESHYLQWDNTDTITEITTVSGTDLVVPFSGACIQTYHRRVFVGSPFDLASNLYRSRLSFSSLDYANNGTTPASPWVTQDSDVTTANFRDIDIDYKGGIIKLTSLKDRLNIYKEYGVYSYNDTSVFQMFGLSPYRGSIQTMEETQEDYLLTNEGFFRTESNPYMALDKAVKPIGEGLYPILKQMLENGIDTSKVHSLAVNYLYFCYMGTVKYDNKTVQNACFVYNAYYDEMHLFSFGHNITSMGYFIDTSGNKQIVFGDVNGFTYKFDYNANTDADQPIEAKFRTKYFFFDAPHKKNHVTEAYPYATVSSEIELAFDTDFNNQYDPFAQLPMREDSVRIEPSKFGAFNELSMEVTWNGKGKRPEFYGIILNIKETSSRMT